MKTRSRIRKGLGIVLVLVVVASLTTAAHADCYRYISGTAQAPDVNQSCAEQLNVTPIFVRMTDVGYDLLIPTPTEETTAMSYRRASSAVGWLAEGTNLASTQAAVETMLTNGAWPLPVPMFEQLNYNLATWLNTNGAAASISSLANDPNFAPSFHCGGGYPPMCTSCQDYFCWPNVPPMFGSCHCIGTGVDCCVIGKELAPSDPE